MELNDGVGQQLISSTIMVLGLSLMPFLVNCQRQENYQLSWVIDVPNC